MLFIGRAFLNTRADKNGRLEEEHLRVVGTIQKMHVVIEQSGQLF